MLSKLDRLLKFSSPTVFTVAESDNYVSPGGLILTIAISILLLLYVAIAIRGSFLLTYSPNLSRLYI